MADKPLPDQGLQEQLSALSQQLPAPVCTRCDAAADEAVSQMEFSRMAGSPLPRGVVWWDGPCPALGWFCLQASLVAYVCACVWLHGDRLGAVAGRRFGTLCCPAWQYHAPSGVHCCCGAFHSYLCWCWLCWHFVDALLHLRAAWVWCWCVPEAMHAEGAHRRMGCGQQSVGV